MSANPWLRAGSALVAAATGLLILSLSLASNLGESDVTEDERPRRTVDEIATVSAMIHATREAEQDSVAAALIGSGESVIAVPHAESSAIRPEPVIDLQSALATAAKLVTGRVVDQRLEWGVLKPWDIPAPVLVSTLVAIDGNATKVAQPVMIGDAPGVLGVRLMYWEGHELLRYNNSYALLVVVDADNAQRFDLIPGYAYEVQADGVLTPAQGITPRATLPPSEQDLRDMFGTAKGTE